MNEIDIVNFFPIYPNIEDEGDKLLDPYKDNFNDVIYHKKEFYDERLDVTEELPKIGSGELLKHQRIIARFMSSHTPYNGLLLVHEMGTGKSCSAFAVTEQIRRETWKEPSVDELESVDLMRRKELYKERMDGVLFKGVMVIARGDNIINNLITELSEKCTAGQYIPEYNTEIEKKIRTKKLLSSYYKFFTFETFAKYLSKLKDEFIVENFSNRIIIIDEAHNLRMQKKKTGLKSVNIYDEFWRFLHLVKGCKVLLLSGTPMKDKPEEIASIMNLILDDKNQLPVGKMFKKEYLDTVIPDVEVPDGFNKSKMEISLVKEDKKEKLKEYFKGHVSYLRAMVSSVKKVYVGESIGKLNYFRVSEDRMSEYQTKYYREALNRDIVADKDKKDKDNAAGVYSFSRQAILFVYPGGLYGPEGFKKFVPETKTTAKKKKRKLLPSFESEFKGTTDEKLAVLSKYSSKYAAVIQNILENEGKSCFVYCEIVQGSGLILFKELLRVFGYSEATGSEKLKGKRCAILSSETTDANKIANILKLFNDPKNMNGEYIQVILGSKIIGEGISLKNVLNINILTPYWNYSETDQAIARGIRVGSHKNLIDSGVVDPVIDIYQRVSMPQDKILSIDLFKYELSENKDISIKSVDRLLKESAFDCALTYNRNVSTYEGMRECDYMDCDYKCDGVESVTDKPKKLETLTYNLYYLDKQRDIIVKKVREMFRDNFILDLGLIREKLPENSLFEIIVSLKLMIDESYEIINKYGFIGYLKEENNVYFLVDSLIAEGNFLSEYYIEYPTVNAEKSFNNILEDILIESLPEMLKKLIDLEDVEEFTKSLYLFPVNVLQTLLEGSVESKNKGIKIDKRHSNFRDRILNSMKAYLVEIEGNIVSSLNKEELRCFDKSTLKWGNCGVEMREKWSNIKQEKEAEVGSNEYGYAGVVNDKNPENFCIRKLGDDVKDTRKISTGKMCKTWHISDLYPVMMNLGIEIPDEPEIKVGNKFKPISGMKTRQIYDQLKDAGEYDENNREEYVKMLYWKKVLKGDGMCKEIRKDMESKNIILSGDCGTAHKKKK